MSPRALVNLFAFVLIALGLHSTTAAFDEIKLADLPKEVKAAVTKKFPKGKLTTAEKVEEDGEDVYQVLLINNKKETEIALHKNGEILWIAIDFPVDKLPAAVRDAIQKAHPKSKLTSASEVLVPKEGKDVLAHYEVEITTASKEDRVVDVLPHGEIELDELSE